MYPKQKQSNSTQIDEENVNKLPLNSEKCVKCKEEEKRNESKCIDTKY